MRVARGQGPQDCLSRTRRSGQTSQAAAEKKELEKVSLHVEKAVVRIALSIVQHFQQAA